MKHLAEKFPNIKIIQKFTDGAPQHFKNYKTALNLYYHEKDNLVPAEMHFFPTAHGKGPCDGLGGTIKGTAARASLRLPADQQILTTMEFFLWLKNEHHFPNVTFAYATVTDYTRAERFLKLRFKNSSRISHIQKQHYILPMGNGMVKCKTFSASTTSTENQVIDKL